MEFTVQNVCGLLIKSKLLTADDVKVLYDRWLKEAASASGNLTAFTRWLVAQQYVTEYQAALVAKGHSDAFFINQYKILDRLGRGRMAGVYKAVHLLGQTVAIKILPPSKNHDAKHLGRFQREMKLALQLKHANVVRSYQVGQANGLYYLVMEYLDGETLDEVLKRRKQIPAPEAVRLIHQALTGLQHIHAQGLVHRDLKPANLMLVPGTKGQDTDTTLRSTLKILDLGLGRATDSDLPTANNLQLTSLGAVLGTPDYLAPEQARDPRSVDIRADIYSVGCVLFHALTGQPPFPDSNILSQIVRHATEPVRPLKELNPVVPDKLQEIVNGMLAKNPGQRYPTPERAAQALQSFLTGAAEPAKPAEETPQLRRFLTWLETNEDQEKPASQQAAAKEHHQKHHHGKKHKKHKGKHSGKPAQAIPVAVGAPVRPAEFDVELVPVAIPTGRRWRMTKRDWLFLAIGALLAGAGTAAVYFLKKP